MKRKKTLTFMAILFSFAITNGQSTMLINLADHSTVKTPFSNIQKITFNTDEMLLKTNTGTENRYLLDDITSISFINELGIQNLKEVMDINIYINGFGEIVVESPLQINQLTVFDIMGRQAAISSQNKLNVNALPTGVYILQVATNKGLVNKKFIKKK